MGKGQSQPCLEAVQMRFQCCMVGFDFLPKRLKALGHFLKIGQQWSEPGRAAPARYGTGL